MEKLLLSSHWLNHAPVHVAYNTTVKKPWAPELARVVKRTQQTQGSIFGTEGSGTASWAPPAGSGAEPQPPTHF